MNTNPESTQYVGQNTNTAAAVLLIAVLMIVYILYPLVPPAILAGWFILQLVCVIVRLKFGWALRNISERGPEWEAAIRRFVVLMTFSGFVWGLASVMVSVYASLIDQIFVLAILLGVAAGGVSTIGPIISAYLPYLSLIMGMQILAFLFGDEPREFLLAVLTTMYTLMVINAGLKFNEVMNNSFVLREMLELAKEDAESGNRAKSKFLSSISHELRTPLNAIIGFSQLLEMDKNLGEEQRSKVSHIYRASEHLLALISQVLDLSKVDSGQIELNIERIELDGLFADCESLMKPVAADHGVSTEFQHPEKPIYFYADKLRVKQVLLNLISNAIKYNKPQGTVKVTFDELSDEKLRISVKDTGLGIAKHLQPDLFEAFNRLGNESSTKEGTGIGLVITRELVQLMGGTIDFESEENAGSKFWIELNRIATNPT